MHGPTARKCHRHAIERIHHEIIDGAIDRFGRDRTCGIIDGRIRRAASGCDLFIRTHIRRGRRGATACRLLLHTLAFPIIGIAGGAGRAARGVLPTEKPSHGIVGHRLPGWCTCAGQTRRWCTTGHIPGRIVTGGIAPRGARHGIQMACIPIRISAARRSRRQPIEHVIGIALLILCTRERPRCQALAWRCSRRACPYQPIQIVVAEGLIVCAGGQCRVGGEHIASGVKAAGSGRRALHSCSPCRFRLGQTQIEIIRPTPRERAVADTRTGWFLRRACLAAIANGVHQCCRRVVEGLRRPVQPSLRIKAGGDGIPIRIRQRCLLSGVVESFGEGIRRAADRHRPPRLLPAPIIREGITAGHTLAGTTGKRLARQAANTQVSARGVVIRVTGQWTRPVAVRRFPEWPVHPIIPHIHRSTRATRINALRLVPIEIIRHTSRLPSPDRCW